VVYPRGPETLIELDPLFVEVCEPGTLRVTGLVSDVPACCGASVIEGRLLRLLIKGRLPAEVVLTVRGTRKGFSGVRLTPSTAAQKQRNDRFWSMARERI